MGNTIISVSLHTYVHIVRYIYIYFICFPSKNMHVLEYCLFRYILGKEIFILF